MVNKSVIGVFNACFAASLMHYVHITRKPLSAMTKVRLHVPNQEKMIEEMAIIRTVIHEYQSTDDFTTKQSSFETYKHLLAKNRYFEICISRAKRRYIEEQNEKQANKVENIRQFLIPQIQKYRKEYSREKTQYISSALMEGAGTFDLVLSKMYEKGQLDEHLLEYLDNLIFNNPLQISSVSDKKNQHLSSKFLAIIRERIIAEIRMADTGDRDFMGTLSFCLSMSNDKQGIKDYLEKTVKSIQKIEDFEDFLDEAIKFSDGKLAPEDMNTIRYIRNTVESLHPLRRDSRMSYRIERENNMRGPDVGVEDILNEEMERLKKMEKETET